MHVAEVVVHMVSFPEPTNTAQGSCGRRILLQLGQDAFLNRTSAARIGVCACATNIPSAVVIQEPICNVVQNRPPARHQMT